MTIKLLVCLALSWASAQGGRSRRGREAPAPREAAQAAPRWEPKDQLGGLDEEMRSQHELQLSELRKSSPQAYEDLRAQTRREEELDAVVEKARKGELSDAEARRRLESLVLPGLREELDGLDARIERLERTLDFLKKARQDSSVLVRRRIRELLDRSGPGPAAPGLCE